jgi:hypothetical protein
MSAPPKHLVVKVSYPELRLQAENIFGFNHLEMVTSTSRPLLSASFPLISHVAAQKVTQACQRARDIDALVILPESDWQSAVENAAKFGIVPRIGEALEFARRSRVLLMRHAATGIALDVTLGGLSFETSAVEAEIAREISRAGASAPHTSSFDRAVSEPPLSSMYGMIFIQSVHGRDIGRRKYCPL